ncbi:TRAP transporter substrate-binding protein DctP [Aliamphritea ceti]|uniref:TRAP transporter substrate-binding protein DctP n=1 Tax=Aliamphritea ceti TaxID=1524258 RepID=UPI0021C25C80|nr:TRAP transporter substrate-binding protein DctP [Aliamphritea ceti]
MNRRKLIQGAIGTCAALVCSTFIQSNAIAGDKVRLRFQTYFGTEMDSVNKAFVKNVKEWSGGSLRIQLFRAGELVSSDQMVDSVSKGTIDMAHGVGAYWSGQMDIGNLEAGLPGAWSTIDEAKDLFFNQGFSDLLSEAYAEKGVHYITTGFGGRYDLLTKDPVNTLDDLKKMKVRASPQAAKVLKELEIPSVYLPSQELYVGMSTGVINGVIYGGPFDYVSLKLNETAKYYTTLNMLTPGWTETYMMNQSKWDNLSDEHKDVLTRATKQMAEDAHQVFTGSDEEILKQDTFVVSALSDEDSTRITTAAQKVWNEEAGRSDRNAKAVAILRDNAKKQGRL